MDQFPNNIGGRFTNTHQHPIILEGKWEVGLSSIICKSYNISQLTTEHEKLTLRVFNANSTHKINGWKTYSQITNLEGVQIACVDKTLPKFEIKLFLDYRYFTEIVDRENASLGFEYLPPASTGLAESRFGSHLEIPIYVWINYSIPLHNIQDIVEICNNEIKCAIEMLKCNNPVISKTVYGGVTPTSLTHTNTATEPPNSEYTPIVFSANKVKLIVPPPDRF